jgi:hypothetical protein
MQAQHPDQLDSESSSSGPPAHGDSQSFARPVLESGDLSDVINLSMEPDSTRVPMTSDDLQKLALKLHMNPHVTALNLGYQRLGPDTLLELAPPLALLTSLRELNLAGELARGNARAAAMRCLHTVSVSMSFSLTPSFLPPFEFRKRHNENIRRDGRARYAVS